TEDGVGQTTLLTNVLEESRAHRATENRVQHVDRMTIDVGLRIGWRADADVALLDLLVPFGETRRDRRRLGDFNPCLAGQRRKRPVDQVAQSRVFEMTGSGNHEIRRDVRSPEVVAQTR